MRALDGCFSAGRDRTASSFLILAIVMIVFMKAVVPDEVAAESEPVDAFGRPLSMFRDRYNVSSTPNSGP